MEPDRICHHLDVQERAEASVSDDRFGVFGGRGGWGGRVLRDPDHNCWFRFKYSGQKAHDIDPDVPLRD